MKGHAVAGHGGERLSHGLLLQTGLAGTQFARAHRVPLIGQSVTALLGAAASVGLPWGRSQDSEADPLGLVYMASWMPEALAEYSQAGSLFT
jgi:peptidase M48-like protein